MLDVAKSLDYGHASRNPAPGRPTAVVAIADEGARNRAVELLTELRWNVTAASSGAQAFTQLDHGTGQVLLLDSWLPDLDLTEFMQECRSRYPSLDVVMMDTPPDLPAALRHPRRHELLHVLRQSAEHHGSATGSATESVTGAATGALTGAAAAAVPKPAPQRPASPPHWTTAILPEDDAAGRRLPHGLREGGFRGHFAEPEEETGPAEVRHGADSAHPLSEFVGNSQAMTRFKRMIRLVAPRRTTVLIEGPTGTGKELTARAIHRLSPRAAKPMVVLNCAAIPEALLEAEVFGHTKGAFTGAVSSRVGRIEAANGGTLFLDEIGEMPQALQSKLLRFLESGELQRVGENDSVRVDVRVIAATNQPLGRRVADGAFRSDLYYRLAVFPIATPRLLDHAEDIPQMVRHFLKRQVQSGAAKQMSAEALEKIVGHSWPGNVRELEHCIERACILADESPLITAEDIQFGNF